MKKERKEEVKEIEREAMTEQQKEEMKSAIHTIEEDTVMKNHCIVVEAGKVIHREIVLILMKKQEKINQKVETEQKITKKGKEEKITQGNPKIEEKLPWKKRKKE